MDLSKLSDDELRALSQRARLQSMSDEELLALAGSQAEDPGAFKAGVIGAGRMLDRVLVKGPKELALKVPAAFGHQGSRDELARMEQEEAGNTRAYEGLQKIRPVATLVGEVAPMLAAPALGTGVAGMAAGAAIPGLMEYGTGAERLQRGAMGAVGGAVGAGAGNLAARLLRPNTAPVSRSMQAAQEAADRLGVNLRASEKTGSRTLGWVEGALNDLPVSGGMAQKGEAARKAAINSAAARALGQQGDEITPQLLAAARQDTSNAYTALIGTREIVLDPTFRAQVQSVAQSKVMKALQDQDVTAIVGPFQNLPKGTIKVTGEWFQANKTALDNAIRGAYTANQPGKARALEKFERALEGAAERSMTAPERAAFKTAQKQWSSLRMLETGAVVEGGNVMPGRLNAAMQQRYKNAMKEGKITGELADIAKLGEVFKPLPQSGTTPRAVYSGMIGGGALFEPMTAASLLGAPALAQGALQSKAGQKYLTKGLLSLTEEQERMLKLIGAGLLSAPATSVAP